MHRFYATVVLLLLPLAVLAGEDVPSDIVNATVMVVCDGRQGSGTVMNASAGYVLTSGHVVVDIETLVPANDCQVSFAEDIGEEPKSFYQATVVHAVFDVKTDLDFAVLDIGPKVVGRSVEISSIIKTNEFASVGDTITVLGYSNGRNKELRTSTGTILGFSRGSVITNAVIKPGFSGGPAIDSQNRYIGMAARISFSRDPLTGQETVVDYQLGDVLPMITWLDTFGPHSHGTYLEHADQTRFHSLPFLYREESLGCQYLARTDVVPAVYCLLPSQLRLVFPDEKTFRSWFPDFTQIFFATPEQLASYKLIGNVTHKAGSLIKIQTDPKVYLVTDSIGTLRHVPSEERAREYFGPNWANKISDVSDAFFVNYRITEPLP